MPLSRCHDIYSPTANLSNLIASMGCSPALPECFGEFNYLLILVALEPSS
jgi:hypothetical protein